MVSAKLVPGRRGGRAARRSSETPCAASPAFACRLEVCWCGKQPSMEAKGLLVVAKGFLVVKSLAEPARPV